MSRPIAVTFIGGPEDGRRVALSRLPARYRVMVLPNLPTYAPLDETTPEPVFTVDQFVYVHTRLPGDNVVFYPEAWNDLPNETPHDRICTALLRGYVGRPS